MLSRRLLDLCRQSRQALVRRLATKTERPYTQLRLLQAIDECGCSSQRMLADKLCLDPPAISRLVERLVDDGLLERKDGADRRRVALSVTAAGRRELKVLRAAQEWLDGEMNAELGAPERTRFAASLDKIEAALRADAEGADDADDATVESGKNQKSDAA